MPGRVLLSLLILVGVLSAPCFGLTLTGQVVDTRAQPIQDAEVVVCEQYSVSVTFQDANALAPVVKTDAQGRFAFELDPALNGNVSRQRNIFVVARKTGLACAWEWLNTSLNTWARRDFPLVLEPAGELGGQVLDAEGNPVKGAEVQALPLTYSGFEGLNDTWRVPGPKAWFSATTDAQGRFRFDQLSANANACLRVRVPGSQNGYSFLRGPCSLHGFWVGQSGIRLRLPGVGTIVGQVRDDRGRPVPAVELKVCFNTYPESRCMTYKDRMTRSDAHGFFQFKDMPEGPHWIDVRGHGRDLDPWVGKRVDVSVKAGRTSRRSVVCVTKGGMYDVTVRHARTGRLLGNMEVGLNNDVWGRHLMLTDARGRARIRALPGTHSMYVGGDRVSLWRTTQTVRSGQTLPVEASVDSAPKVTGRVVDVQNQPVAQALVIVRTGDHVLTDAKGQFSAYCSKTRPANAIWIMARDRARDRAALRQVTDLSRPVTLKLKPVQPLIGQVTDPQGRPVCAAWVDLDSHTSNSTARMDERVVTDRQGRFTLRAIPPKQPGFDYRLKINAAGYGPAKRRRIEAWGQGDEPQDIGRFILNPATESISGCVVNAKGVPVQGAELGVNSVGGVVPQHYITTATDEQGRFRLPHLSKGAIVISASHSEKKHGGEGTVTLLVPAADVRIVLGKEVFHDAAVSLLGKALPDLSTLSRDIDPDEIKSRPVLLCLIDIAQRPSRRCLKQIAEQVDSLASRGVTPVVVQVSKVDLTPYSAFLRAGHIEMPIRMMVQDFEAKKREWGVKGLPWLLLTDQSHAVVREGSNVGEVTN